MSLPVTVGPGEPPPAAAVFGTALPMVQQYADLLAGPAVERGLLGPREVPVLWERHILNCVAVTSLLPVDATVVDVGSGAGLPGIVLALARPDLAVTLVEPMARRCIFLTEVLDALALATVTVRQARAEELAGQLGADVAVARAVAPLPRLLPLCAPLLRPGGVVLAIKGRTAGRELAAAQGALASFDARGDIQRLSLTDDLPGTTVVRIVVDRPMAQPRPTAPARSGRRAGRRREGKERR